MEYSRTAASPQQFCNLYYGNTNQIKDLERYVKSQWNKYRLNEFSERNLEWLDPQHKINVSDLEKLVESRIVNYPYDTIKKVKKIYLPFSVDNQGLFDNIILQPEQYLEDIT
jgi:hypothetical protein